MSSLSRTSYTEAVIGRDSRNIQDAVAQVRKMGMMTSSNAYTPPLGRSGLTASYDRVVAMMTREKAWRGKLLDAVGPAAAETIVDIGSGTGTLAIMLARAGPVARIVAVDFQGGFSACMDKTRQSATGSVPAYRSGEGRLAVIG